MKGSPLIPLIGSSITREASEELRS